MSFEGGELVGVADAGEVDPAFVELSGPEVVAPGLESAGSAMMLRLLVGQVLHRCERLLAGELTEDELGADLAFGRGDVHVLHAEGCGHVVEVQKLGWGEPVTGGDGLVGVLAHWSAPFGSGG